MQTSKVNDLIKENTIAIEVGNYPPIGSTFYVPIEKLPRLVMIPEGKLTGVHLIECVRVDDSSFVAVPSLTVFFDVTELTCWYINTGDGLVMHIFDPIRNQQKEQTTATTAAEQESAELQIPFTESELNEIIGVLSKQKLNLIPKIDAESTNALNQLQEVITKLRTKLVYKQKHNYLTGNFRNQFRSIIERIPSANVYLKNIQNSSTELDNFIGLQKQLYVLVNSLRSQYPDINPSYTNDLSISLRDSLLTISEALNKFAVIGLTTGVLPEQTNETMDLINFQIGKMVKEFDNFINKLL